MSRARAISLYEDFHKYRPKEVGRFPNSFKIPRFAEFVGPALYVLYRSEKYDPITYQPPDAPIDYIHEHKAGVKVYWCEQHGSSKVPSFICKADNLVSLGGCLGFGYIDENNDEIEATCDPDEVELYSAPSGKGLLVVENKREVVAMIWGGKLRVEPRGIVG